MTGYKMVYGMSMSSKPPKARKIHLTGRKKRKRKKFSITKAAKVIGGGLRKYKLRYAQPKRKSIYDQEVIAVRECRKCAYISTDYYCKFCGRKMKKWKR